MVYISPSLPKKSSVSSDIIFDCRDSIAKYDSPSTAKNLQMSLANPFSTNAQWRQEAERIMPIFFPNLICMNIYLKGHGELNDFKVVVLSVRSSTISLTHYAFRQFQFCFKPPALVHVIQNKLAVV